MLLLMIERGLPIDTVLWADTGMEFPEMYDHIRKVDDYLYRERGIHITMLRHPKGFEYLMFEEEKQRPSSIENRQRLGVSLYGNGWPGAKVRWCTGQLKTHLISKEVNRLKGEYQALHYVGIAADEPKRIKNEQYPLVDWGITEAEALKICYDRGYDWSGLYEIYHRCSCWCCPLQRINELRKLRHHHPELSRGLRKDRWEVSAIPYLSKEQLAAAREMDLLTYLRRFDPEELVHIGGNTYTTRTHDSLKISNGKWCWWSRNIQLVWCLKLLYIQFHDPEGNTPE